MWVWKQNLYVVSESGFRWRARKFPQCYHIRILDTLSSAVCVLAITYPFLFSKLKSLVLVLCYKFFSAISDLYFSLATSHQTKWKNIIFLGAY